MTRKNYLGIVKIILWILLVALVISLISDIVEIFLGNKIADILSLIIVIGLVLWLLSREGQRKVQDLLDEAGFR